MLEPRWRWACPAELETSQVGAGLGGGQGGCWQWGLASSPLEKAVGLSAQAVFGDPLEGSPAGLGRPRLLRPTTGKSWLPMSDHPYGPPLGPLDTPAWKKGPSTVKEIGSTAWRGAAGRRGGLCTPQLRRTLSDAYGLARPPRGCFLTSEEELLLPHSTLPSLPFFSLS